MCVMVYLMCYIDENLTCFTKRSRKKRYDRIADMSQNPLKLSFGVRSDRYVGEQNVSWSSRETYVSKILSARSCLFPHINCVLHLCVWSHNSSVESAHAYKRIWWYSFVSTKPIYRAFMMWCDIRAVPSPIATIPVNNVKNLTRTYHIRSWIHILR